MRHLLTVLKFGGSVLRGPRDFTHAIAEVRRWNGAGTKVVAIVSAFEGTTDRLLAEARALHAGADHDPAALAMLLATGEFTTAAQLTLALSAAGLRARTLGPGALALRARGDGADADPCSINLAALERTLDAAEVAVVPGFIAQDDHGNLCLLGRGGSDITAIFIAAHAGAERCRLIKDVPGVYDRDPNLDRAGAHRFRTLHYDDALSLDGGIIQHKAVRFARALGATFEVTAWARDDATRVGPSPSVFFEKPDARGARPSERAHEPNAALCH
ncbi:MAG: hypothetical protein ACKVZJ_05725 [Phycisphaerales bacterium]